MKTKIIVLLLLYIPILTMGQTELVEKLVNGKPCDTCLVKSHMHFSNIFPKVFIETYANPNRLIPEITRFDELLSKMNKDSKLNTILNSERYIITDSIFNLVYLTYPETDYKYGDKNFNYKEVEIRIEKNQKILKDWQILDKLPTVSDYKINKFIWNEKNLREDVASWSSTHQTGAINLAYNDLITITLRTIDSKEIIQKIYIKRLLDTPKHFDYYQTPTNSKGFKESLQSFLNDPISSEYIRKNDTTKTYELKRNNVGVLLFNSLEDGEEIEYKLDKKLPWKSIRKGNGSVFQSKYIILDNEDIPPGTTKTLYLRYKDQPETEIPITIRGTEDIAQTSIFKIIAGFMLATLLFGTWYYFAQKRTKKRLARLQQKNKDIENQLSLLSGQLNPHFLFNSLNAIQGTIMNNDSESANAYISEVAGFMRRVMDDGKKEFISLEEELNLEQDYLKLEQKRKKFDYNIITSSTLNTAEIDFPPLLLQPTLENSIRHGLTQDNENLIITIDMRREDKNLILQISDNGQFWDTSQIIEGQGLSLTQKRMMVYNEKLVSMQIAMHTVYSKGTITTFTFKNWLI